MLAGGQSDRTDRTGTRDGANIAFDNFTNAHKNELIFSNILCKIITVYYEKYT
jgi:hypothetical protein